MDRPRSSVFVPSFHSHICLPTTNIARSNPMRVICATAGSIARKVPRHSSSRRHVLTALVPLVVLGVGAMNPRIASAAVGKPVRLLHQLAEIDPSLTPDATAYDATDERLRQAGRLIQQALNASTIEEEERMWTQIIDEFSDVDAVWRDDVVGRYGCCNSPLPRPSALSHPLARCLAVSLSRALSQCHDVTLSQCHALTLSSFFRAYGNRGNCRSRQGKAEAALKDYDESIRICPWSVDPVLNRGVLFENQLMFEEAIADYRAVLKVSPNDPVGWNNLGNAQMGAGQFDDAISSLDRAVKLGGNRYAFAQANKAVALYAKGDDGEAEREMLSLLRRFPNFAEVRASLGALQWMKGEREKAEENWLRVNDGSYRSVDWLRNQRRWPKRLVDAAEAYLSLS